jgi:hypothetical protein
VGSYASPWAFADGLAAAMGVSAGRSLLSAPAGAALPGRPRTNVRARAALEGDG